MNRKENFMYLHIGKNTVLDSRDIIGIFDMDSLKDSHEINKIFEDLKKENNIINVSESIEKSLVLTKIDGIIKGFISNISSTTLAKRAEKFQ